MSHVEAEPRAFEPGTTGWTARDLDDPVIEREWFRGRYEIVEGVLTKMPPAYFTGGEAVQNLVFVLRDFFKQRGVKGSFATEVDIIVDQARVAVADAVFLTIEERKRQNEAARRAGRTDEKRTRILIPPTLIIESVSPGHEVHDQQTKRRWYAEFGVPNYWILDAYQRSLECLILGDNSYRTDQSGGGDAELHPSAFGGLTLRLRDLWGE